MILLDTNVVSEIYRPRPSLLVLAWLDAQPREELYMCAPVLAELRFGLELLDESDRKERLRATIDRLQNELYHDRILAFDISAAIEYARIAALRQKAGNVMEQLDCLIAAIALANGANLATRNTRHFANIGLDLINPFETRTKD
jgi:predicted nucleic acid-binding protein